jgi:hypothetical protein
MRPWVMSPKLAMRFRVGRIFLVGDAAARLLQQAAGPQYWPAVQP